MRRCSTTSVSRHHAATKPSNLEPKRSTPVNSLDILFRPIHAWRNIAETSGSLVGRLLTHTVPWALVPALCWYYGITTVGWQIGEEPVQKMTADSAIVICALFYLAMLAGVVFLGYMIHWMAETYAAANRITSYNVCYTKLLRY